jgi:hypothetical protein
METPIRCIFTQLVKRKLQATDEEYESYSAVHNGVFRLDNPARRSNVCSKCQRFSWFFIWNPVYGLIVVSVLGKQYASAHAMPNPIKSHWFKTNWPKTVPTWRIRRLSDAYPSSVDDFPPGFGDSVGGGIGGGTRVSDGSEAGLGSETVTGVGGDVSICEGDNSGAGETGPCDNAPEGSRRWCVSNMTVLMSLV